VPAASTRAQLAAQLAWAQPQHDQVALGANVAHRAEERREQPEDRQDGARRRGHQQGAEDAAGDGVGAQRPLHLRRGS
jgi:hypothetical protein